MATGAASGPTAAGSTLSGAYLRAQRSGGAVRCERGPVRAVGDERGVDIGGSQNAAGQGAALFQTAAETVIRPRSWTHPARRISATSAPGSRPCRAAAAASPATAR